MDSAHPDFGDLFDELPLWSAPFGLMLLDRVPLRPDLSVLDVGAGTGFLSLELAQRCGPRSRVVAVDSWPAATKRLRRKLEMLGLGNVRVLEQDAATLELAAASIDVVVCNLGLNNFEDPEAVLKACARAMKPGARMLLTSNLVGHMGEFYEVFRAALLEVGLGERIPALDAHLAHRGTADSVRRLLTSAGLVPGRVTTDTLRLRYADGTALLAHALIRFGFRPAWEAVVGAADVPRAFAALEHRLNELAAGHGELSLSVPMACFEAERPAPGR